MSRVQRISGEIRVKIRFVMIAALATAPGHAFAGETILYQPTPSWVKLAAVPASGAASGAGDAPSLLVYDTQQRVENGQLWQYSDTAAKIASPEMLAQFSTIGAQWSPDKGDLIVHEVAIIRNGETLNLLAKGMKLDVLRREELLEQRQLTGMLSATGAIEGLRVGDVFRMRYSVTMRDAVLNGRVQSISGLPARPLRLDAGHLRAIWPASEKAKWQFLASGITASPVRRGDTMELDLALPVPKQPEIPGDAPARYASPGLFELTTFADWPDVSRTFFPLYRPKGLIADGTPLAAEADRIAAASSDPLARTQAALQLAQDQVRYLALNMNAGNYTPQSPEETWKLRYGDCKAKTLLLLALLDRLGIEAEAVLASARGGGHALLKHLPSAAVFDHVLVRARLDGQSLWLDGTGIGSRLDDIHDTPDLGYVLPLRADGAEPERIVTHANARPSVDLAITYDESTSIDLPPALDAKLTLRGPQALSLGLAANALDPEQRDELVRQQLTQAVGEGLFTDLSLETSTATATTVLKGRGIVTGAWKSNDRQTVRRFNGLLSQFSFAPDRARAEWRDIPVATMSPFAIAYHVTVRLPDQGKGYTLEGAPEIDTTLGGTRFVGRARLDGGTFVYDERSDSTGAEIAPAQVAADRAATARAQAQVPRLVAPDTATRRWNLGDAPKSTSQLATVNALLEKAMAAKEPSAEVWQTRANLRRGTGDFKGARADLDRAIALSADASSYLDRARLNRSLGDLPAALADARKAQELDPSQSGSAMLLAALMAQQGDAAAARELLDEKIALGGDERRAWEMSKVETLGLYADAAEALGLLDVMMEKRPQSPDLLNLACWIKGMRGIDVDGALRQCSSAIELTGDPSGPLDSRAVVWLRLGRYDDALRDLDAVLRDAPTQAESRYMRGVVLAHLGRAGESRAEIAVARTLDPGIAALYERLGIKP